ncbi:MAG: alpha-L-fucosidase [Barnesiella sp.]
MKKTCLLIFCIIVAQFQLFSLNKMDWFNNARFGMFIHWGVYSTLGGVYIGPSLNGYMYTPEQPFVATYIAEWIMSEAYIPRAEYRKYASKFTAEKFVPDSIAILAKTAGMKYIVLTIKHHEGFILYPSAFSDWCTTNSGANGRDLVRELIDAAKRQDIKIGIYFSQNLDWMAPGSLGGIPEIGGAMYPREQQMEYIQNTCKIIDEFTTRYGDDIDIIWWDAPYTNKDKEFTNMLKSALENNPHYRPEIIQNNRLSELDDGDYDTPEGILMDIPKRPYELCYSMTYSWGFLQNSEFKSPLRVLHELLRTLSKGGNLLLNVAPRADGSITEEEKNVLRYIGNYISVNKESIYGTESNEFMYGQDFGVITRKGNTLYLHYYVGENLKLFGVENKILNAYILSDGTPVIYEKIPGGYWFHNIPKGSTVCVDFEDITIDEGRVLGGNEPGTELTVMAASPWGDLLLNGIEDYPNFGGWRDENAYLSWPLQVTETNKYDIYVTISGYDAGTATITIGDNYLEADYPALKNFDNYIEIKMGTCELKEGKYEVKFGRKPVSLLNFHKIRIIKSELDSSDSSFKDRLFQVIPLHDSNIMVHIPQIESLVSLDFYTVMGNNLHRISGLSSGNHKIMLPLNLSPGIYIVSFSDQKGEVLSIEKIKL